MLLLIEIPNATYGLLIVVKLMVEKLNLATLICVNKKAAKIYTEKHDLTITSKMSDDWNEFKSLEDLDELLNFRKNLEEEDVTCLDEYLAGTSIRSDSSECWSSVNKEKGHNIERSPLKSQISTEDEDDAENVDDPESLSSVVRPQDSETEKLSRSSKTCKGKPYMCELCGMRLATADSRRRHILAKHIKERPNVCDVCGKAFVFKFALKAHMAVHSDTPSFVCVCGMSFTGKGSYMDHIRRIHRAAPDVKYSCELCFKSYGDRHTLRIHLISVHKPKTIPCMQEGCKKVFSTIGLMRSHYRYHLKQRFTCDECGSSFSTESYMNKHRLTHSGIRPYVCVDCGKTYMRASNLNKHSRIAHSSVRPFQCSICGKCFKAKEQLTCHESSHKGEKPFKCHICGYATAYSNTYYAHRKKHKLKAENAVANSQDQQKPSAVNRKECSSSGKQIQSNDVTKNQRFGPSELKRKNTGFENEKGRSKVVDSSTTKTLPGGKKNLNSTLSSQVLKCGSKATNTKPDIHVQNKNFFMSSPSAMNSLDVFSSDVNSSKCFQQDNTYNGKETLSCDDGNNSGAANSYIKHNYSRKNTNNSIHLKGIDDSSCQKNSAITSCRDLKVVSGKDIGNEDVSVATGKEAYIILPASETCALPNFESGGDSLLLLEIDTNSYISMCSPHISEETIIIQNHVNDGDKQIEVSEQVEQSGNNDSMLQPVIQKYLQEESCSTYIAEEALSAQNTKVSETQTHNPNNKNYFISSSTNSETVLLFSDAILPQPSKVTTESPKYNNSTASSPVSQKGVNSISELHRIGDFPPVLELNSGIASLSGQEEPLNFAQLEVVCPLCDEQFLCMDEYVIHLENNHS